MAKLILDGNDKEAEVVDGGEIKDACEESFDIPFGCEDGQCGTCIVEIVSGMENLNDKNEKENDLLPNENERLACQCKIKKGDVRIKY